MSDPTVEYVKIILKQYWGGKFAKALKPFEDLVTTVRFVDTGTPLCKTKEECIPVMKKLQEEDFESNGWDLKYNFYIGGDGSVFEGRGWNVESWKPEDLQDLKGNCLDIAYLTNLSEDKITPEMKQMGERILEYGRQLGYLTEGITVMNIPE